MAKRVSRPHNTLLNLLQDFGFRGILNALADVLDDAAKKECKLPYRIERNKVEVWIEPGDMKAAATNLREENFF